MYFVFVSLNALGPLLDFGLLTAISRAVGFALGGAEKVPAHGILEPSKGAQPPNYGLIWQLLSTTRVIYRLLAVAVMVVLGLFGTYMVGLRVHETTSETLTWISWGAALLGTGLELYFSWWTIFLRSLDRVLESTRILVFAYTLKLGCTLLFLALGAKLLSLPLASLICSLVMGVLSRRKVLVFVPRPLRIRVDRQTKWDLIKTLWPSNWRVGVQFFSAYFTTNANNLLCLKFFGLQVNAEYGLSIQLMNLIGSMATAWTAIKWPRFTQLRMQGEVAPLRKMFWPVLWLQTLSFILVAAIGIFLFPIAMRMLGAHKSILPQPWISLMAVYFFFENQLSTWCSLIFSGNRHHFLWAIVISNLSSLLIAFILIQTTGLGVAGLVIASLISGCLLNYWYWPKEGARSLETTWTNFMFSRPR
jgi:O-antigen/teichoic acid export membrane protein